jgi:hypothetical protein
LNLFSVLNAYQRRIRPTPEPGQTRWSLKHGAISVVPRVAYINHGRWVADCVRPYCGGAEALRPHQVVVECFECHLVAPVEWPREAQELWEALMVRPVPATRNWFPAGHRLAVRAGCRRGCRRRGGRSSIRKAESEEDFKLTRQAPPNELSGTGPSDKLTHE